MASVRGQSLTPSSRSNEVTQIGLWDGTMSAVCTMIPTSLGLWYGMKHSPSFVKYTNWQSRTAMLIMPPCFMFSLSSELKLNHKMREMAEEKEHSTKVSEWAENQQRMKDFRKEYDITQLNGKGIRNTAGIIKRQTEFKFDKLDTPFTDISAQTEKKEELSEVEREKQLAEIYRKSIELSGIRIVPGSSLGIHHRVANFWQENPFKILMGLSVPTVGFIFYGRNNKEHLMLQSKIMHTRIFGQFAVIGLLLTLMGFKGYMDVYGKFITEADAERRVEEMKAARMELAARLEHDRNERKYLEFLKSKANIQTKGKKKRSLPTHTKQIFEGEETTVAPEMQ